MSGQVRFSLLNIPDDMSLLKFRGYLRTEAQGIQSQCKDNDFVVIRVFIPKKLKLLITQREQDKIFRAIVDNMPNIYRVELAETERQLSFEEMKEEGQQAQAVIDALIKDVENKKSDGEAPTLH